MPIQSCRPRLTASRHGKYVSWSGVLADGFLREFGNERHRRKMDCAITVPQVRASFGSSAAVLSARLFPLKQGSEFEFGGGQLLV